MKSKSVHTVPALLSYYSIGSDNLSKLACGRCRATLDVHQPDPEQPDQFLGTCSGCGRWFRIAHSLRTAGLTILEMPEIAALDRPPVAFEERA